MCVCVCECVCVCVCVCMCACECDNTTWNTKGLSLALTQLISPPRLVEKLGNFPQLSD